MEIKPTILSEVHDQLQRTFQRAKESIRLGDYKLAFDLLETILRVEPGLDEVRRVLRQGQLEASRLRHPDLRRVLAWPRVIWTAKLKGPGLLKHGKLVEALDLAEKAMKLDPTHPLSIAFLAKALDSARLYDMAKETVQLGLREQRDNVRLLEMLASLHQKTDQAEEALKILERLCRLNPEDQKAQSRFRQATALVTMKRSRWEDAGSYREVIKDEEEAQVLEQKERLVAHDAEAMGVLIRDAEKAVGEQPTHANHRRLADLYRKNGDFDKALEQYNLVVEKTGTLDPVIDQAITGVLCERFDDAIAQWQAFAEQEPDKQDEAEQNIQAIRQQKAETVFTRTKQRVERYPNDVESRFALAELYWQQKQMDEALRHFQMSQRNPRFKLQAELYIAKCMAAKGMLDMAADQLREALASSKSMNATRKEILYDLGLLYEQLGYQAESATCFKEIFAADVNYRDVGKRLEASYGASKGTEQ